MQWFCFSSYACTWKHTYILYIHTVHTYTHTYIHTYHNITLHCIALLYTTLPYITLHGITFHLISLRYITLYYITIHTYLTLPYLTLHYITIHYITIHYITPHSIYIYIYITLPYMHACIHTSIYVYKYIYIGTQSLYNCKQVLKYMLNWAVACCFQAHLKLQCQNLSENLVCSNLGNSQRDGKNMEQPPKVVDDRWRGNGSRNALGTKGAGQGPALVCDYTGARGPW